MRTTDAKTSAADQRPLQSLATLASLPHTTHTFWRGATVYSLDDTAAHIYSVISGRVKILRASAEGQQTIISIRHAGDLFGELALAGGAAAARHSDEAVALDTTCVALVRVEEFWQATRHDPALAQVMLGDLAMRLYEAHRQIGSLVFEDNSHRLMRALFELSGKAARAGEASVRLTHDGLAGLIGSAREVVTGLMLDLRRRGLIDYKRGEVLPCLPKLAHFLGEEEPYKEQS